MMSLWASDLAIKLYGIKIYLMASDLSTKLYSIQFSKSMSLIYQIAVTAFIVSKTSI